MSEYDQKLNWLRGYKIPKWEYGGTFNKAAKMLHEIAEDCLACNNDKGFDIASMFCVALENTHVVNIDFDQFAVLANMPIDEDLLQFVPDTHLQFDPLYISIGDETLAGILVTTYAEGTALVCFMNAGFPFPAVTLFPDHTWTDYVKIFFPEQFAKHPDLTWNENKLAHVAWASFKVVRFLESANVDIADTIVSRQVRRNAQRKNLRIASTVTVRSPRSRRAATFGDSTSHREFSHRFEVAGHYKHYGPGTRIFDATERDRPQKVINHSERGRIVPYLVSKLRKES